MRRRRSGRSSTALPGTRPRATGSRGGPPRPGGGGGGARGGARPRRAVRGFGVRLDGACTLPAPVAETNPDITPEEIRKRIEGSFPADMGVEPLELTDERCRGRIVVDDRHLHPGRL